jgi:hypothetical protein
MGCGSSVKPGLRQMPPARSLATWYIGRTKSVDSRVLLLVIGMCAACRSAERTSPAESERYGSPPVTDTRAADRPPPPLASASSGPANPTASDAATPAARASKDGEPQDRTRGSGACFAREPATVVLSGVIERSVFPGPPNYESVAKGDAEEICWLLTLRQPICLEAGVDLSGAIDDNGHSGIRKIQLVFEGSDGYRIYRDLVGKSVQATGGLFAAFSGHHHAEVLMTVDDLAPAPRAPMPSASR